VQKEETSNHAAQRHYGTNKLILGEEETKGATEHDMDNDNWWQDSYKGLSDDEVGHTGPSDRPQTILADKIKCCTVFIKLLNV
jgi:hypothetical protein